MDGVAHRSTTATNRILWVEDDPQDRLLIGAALDELGVTGVRFLASGQELLDCLQVVRPDRIILDLGIPDVPGDELLRIVRAEDATARTPVAVFSGIAWALDEQGLAVEESVTKPSVWSEYPAAVERALGDS